MGTLGLVLRSVSRGGGIAWITGACAALTAAVVTGALVVGASVDHSLADLARRRLGDITIAVQGRTFTAALGDRLAEELGAPVAATLSLPGTAMGADGVTSRATVVGVDDDLAGLLPGGGFPAPASGEVAISEALAAQLGAGPGDELTLRVPRGAGMHMEALLARSEAALAVRRLTVSAVVPASAGGGLSLDADQQAPLNAFVGREALAVAVGRPGAANLLLTSHGDVADVEAALAARWSLADAGLELRDTHSSGAVDLLGEAVFLPGYATAAAELDGWAPLSVGVHLADHLFADDRTIPYAIVAGVVGADAPLLARDEIALGEVTAADLGAGVGDEATLQLRAFAEDGTVGVFRRSFRVAAVLPMDGLAGDGDLLPAYPGIANAGSCSDWAPGIPIDLEEIRPEDEAHWEAYRGAPRAFVHLDTARLLWGSRHGLVTSVRFTQPPSSTREIEEAILSGTRPRDAGLVVIPVAERGRAAVQRASDLGSLVLGFSFFVLAAALLIQTLVFGLALRRRHREMGVLLALGFTPTRVRTIAVAEGAAVAAVGATLGAAAGPLYGLAMIRALAPLWADAGTAPALQLTWTAPAAGLLTSIAAAAGAMAVVARRATMTPPARILPSRVPGSASKPRAATYTILAGTSLAGTASLVRAAPPEDGYAAAGYFLGAGFAVMVTGVLLWAASLHLAPTGSATISRAALVWRGLARRKVEAVAAVTLVALCSFLVVAVEAYRRHPHADAGERTSGTGGFDLWAESMVPLVDIPHPDAHGLGLRVRDGDEASCLNLNRPQQPRLIGAPTEALSRRGAFSLLGSDEDPWALLDEPIDGVVPALADQNTLVWSLGMAVGDEIEVLDGHGRPVTLRLVGALSASILQGSVIVAEDRFVDLYPDEPGRRFFLLDAVDAEPAAAAQALGLDLARFGFVATPAVQRLARFHAVENTYLGLFQVLAGLALVLGCGGIGVLLLSQVAGRRRELAVLRALGFDRRRVMGLLVAEHLTVLAAGLGVGLVAALVATGPLALDPETGFPALAFTATLLGTAAAGTAWTLVAARLALRSAPADVLKEET